MQPKQYEQIYVYTHKQKKKSQNNSQSVPQAVQLLLRQVTQRLQREILCNVLLGRKRKHRRQLTFYRLQYFEKHPEPLQLQHFWGKRDL